MQSHRTLRVILSAAILAGLGAGLLSCRQAADDGRIRLAYWEKWTGFEADAMRRVVEDFNASQDRIRVTYLPVSQVERKTLIATAGGDPPDIAGLFVYNIASFADADALVPLDDFIRRAGLPDDHYLPVYRGMVTYRGQTWALPSTPTVTALHWNKALFREVGLDPEQPPRTLAELDAFAEKLTRFGPDGSLECIGFLPQEPVWFAWAYPEWFGGRLWDGEGITAEDPRNVESMRWVRSYSEKYGLDRIREFTSGFGNFSSPQNPFFSGRVAMVFQGVWMHNYITKFAPGMEWGAAAWPRTPGGPEGFAVADADVLAIPRGARHPEASWEFLRYVASQPAMEKLCAGQVKNSPLTRVSPEFLRDHAHPYIREMTALAAGPGATHIPNLGVWNEYNMELRDAFDRVRLLRATPEEAMARAQDRVATALVRHNRSLRRRGKL